MLLGLWATLREWSRYAPEAIALWGMLLVITPFRDTDTEPNGSPWWLSVTGNPSN
ncbi:hypothetical protein [Moorena bouillonii]|uniref:hypothetical protein n=1 Tax=Moorena bouillonii TaxID=207920 RepID=UPI00130164B9|nr:hypothetical protein [Moorena bouillonii]NEQ79653.1 hypothetical protein [Moorena sp. SIO2I5]